MKKPQSHGSIPVTLTYDREGNVKLSPPKKVRLSISDDLARVFARATAVNQSDATPLSFTSLLIGLMTGTDVVSEWLRPELNNFGATLEKIAGRRSRTVNESTLRELDGRHLFSELAMSVSARRAIEEAQRIAALLGNPLLDSRHLAAAYPVLPDWHVDDFRELGIDRLAWCRALGARMAHTFPDEQWYWRDYADRASPVPLTSFSADVYTEKDLLGIDRTVDSLALLIASTRTDTPLAIGVFGPWGAGKSFFMRHLRKRIWAVAGREHRRIQVWQKKRENGSATADDAPLYYDQIAQVEFNAWHYNEGNLVASLVDHMFRNLRVIPGKGDEEVAERRAKVLEQITAAEGDALAIKKSIERKQQEVDIARAEVREATEGLVSAQEEVAQKTEALSQSTAEVETARRQFEAAVETLTKATGTSADAVIQLALAPFTNSQALEGARMAAADFAREVKDWRKFLRSLLTPRGAIVVALCLVAPLTAWLVHQLDAIWAALAGVGATLTASATQVIGFIRERRKEFEIQLKNLNDEETKRLEDTKRLLENEREKMEKDWKETLRVLREELERRQTSLVAREKAARSAIEQLAARTKEFDEKVRERETAEKKLQDLQVELRKVSSAKLLDEFLQDRSGTEDYRKELGFLALVRRDFERLSDLIAAANLEWCSPRSTATEPPLLNRIVLYIDDLDRCKVETVLKVLEVVHLLLAFPLFVCVVAVDPRWIEQCLREKHSDLFTPSQNGETAHVTVGDYLEKIFQIPIWMRPIQNRQRASLVKTLLGNTAAPAAAVPTAAVGASSTDLGAAGAIDEAESAPNGFQATVMKAEETPDPLRITREEATFVDQLAPILSDKPRALKRFVNTYRLLKASLSDIDRQTFVTDDPASPYRICMSQLAFFTGHPRLASVFARQIGRSSADHFSLQQWSDTLPPEERQQLQPIVALFPDHTFVADFRHWLPDTAKYLFHRDD
jgi:hypothetical protein